MRLPGVATRKAGSVTYMGAAARSDSPLSCSWSQSQRSAAASRLDSPLRSSWSMMNDARPVHRPRASSVPDLASKSSSMLDISFKPPPRASTGCHSQNVATQFFADLTGNDDSPHMGQACVLCGFRQTRWRGSWFCNPCGRMTEDWQQEREFTAALTEQRAFRYPSPRTAQGASRSCSVTQAASATRSCRSPITVERGSTRSCGPSLNIPGQSQATSECRNMEWTFRGRSPVKQEQHQALIAPRSRSQDNQPPTYPTLLGDFTPVRKHVRVNTSPIIRMIPLTDDPEENQQIVLKHVRFRTKDSLYNDFTPYGCIYGAHPKTFHFDADGSMIFFGGSFSVPVSPRCAGTQRPQLPTALRSHHSPIRRGSPPPRGAVSAPCSAACSPRKAVPQVPSASTQTFTRADLERMSHDALKRLAMSFLMPPARALYMTRADLLEVLLSHEVFS